MPKVTVQEITKIKAGKVKSFACETPMQARSGQSQVSYIKKFRRDLMPPDVADYKTSINESILTIIALPKQ